MGWPDPNPEKEGEKWPMPHQKNEGPTQNPKKGRVMIIMKIIIKFSITKINIVIIIKLISVDGRKMTGVGPSGRGRPQGWGLTLPSCGRGWRVGNSFAGCG